MTAPAYCVFDGSVALGVAPRRPDALCEDLGGLAFQNATGKNAPKPNEHVFAEDFKQMSMLIERLCRGAWMVAVDFTADAATPTIQNVVLRTDRLIVSDVQLFRTGAGVYQVTVPVGTLPPAVLRPNVTVSLPAYHNACAYSVGEITHIRITDAAGDPVDDTMVNLKIYGI